MKRYEPIKNDDIVIAHHQDNTISKHRFGGLKNDFMNKRIEVPITKVYLPRTNQNFHITYKQTQGFRFKELKA